MDEIDVCGRVVALSITSCFFCVQQDKLLPLQDQLGSSSLHLQLSRWILVQLLLQHVNEHWKMCQVIEARQRGMRQHNSTQGRVGTRCCDETNRTRIRMHPWLTVRKCPQCHRFRWSNPNLRHDIVRPCNHEEWSCCIKFAVWHFDIEITDRD